MIRLASFLRKASPAQLDVAGPSPLVLRRLAGLLKPQQRWLVGGGMALAGASMFSPAPLRVGHV